MCCTKEGMAAPRRRRFAADRGVGIEHLEIIERRLFQIPPFGRRIALDRAIENLSKAEFYLGGKVRDHAAHMMADDFELGKLVEQAGIDQSRHAGRGLIRPSETEPDFVFRSLLRGVIRKIRPWLVCGLYRPRRHIMERRRAWRFPVSLEFRPWRRGAGHSDACFGVQPGPHSRPNGWQYHGGLSSRAGDRRGAELVHHSALGLAGAVRRRRPSRRAVVFRAPLYAGIGALSSEQGPRR